MAQPCCLCLSEDESTFHSNTVMKSMPLHEMVEFCLGVQINADTQPDEIVSTTICNECVLNVNNFYTFKKRVLEAQELIHNTTILNEPQSNDSEDDCIEASQDTDQDEYHNENEFEFEIEDAGKDVDDGVEYSETEIENESTVEYFDENNGDPENNHEQSIQPTMSPNVLIIRSRPNRKVNASLPPPPKHMRKKAKLCSQKPSEQVTLQLNECLICPAILGDIIKLKEHIEAHKQIVCKACHRYFIRYSNLKRHFNSVHSKAKPFTCDWCGLGFNFSANLQSHAALHSSVPK